MDISGHDGKIQAKFVFFDENPKAPQDLDVTTVRYSHLWPAILIPTSFRRPERCNISYKPKPYQRSQFKLSMESPVDNPESTLAIFNRQFGLNAPEKEAVEWAWPMEMGDTMFAVVNTYTRAAQWEELSAESSFKLSRVGGNILGMLN